MIFGNPIFKAARVTLLWGLLFLQGTPSFSHDCEISSNTTRPLTTQGDHSNLNQVLETLKQSSMREQNFHETYTSHMLTTPTYKEGTLVFHPPSLLEKHVRLPTEESFIINGETLLYENPSREISRAFSLHEYPALEILIEGLRSIFNGDKETLRQFFVVSLTGTPEAWDLRLSPIIQNGEDGVNCIRITGKEAHLHSISIQETNGDRSDLQLDPQMP